MPNEVRSTWTYFIYFVVVHLKCAKKKFIFFDKLYVCREYNTTCIEVDIGMYGNL